MNRRKGDWIQTYTGLQFYPLDPRPEDICLVDIAHALSLICRYNGHSRCFYSVAEHSFRMSTADLYVCPKWRLMHDAAEAYLSDVPMPIKPMLPGFKEIENSIMSVIAQKYELKPLSIVEKSVLKYADRIMLATEKRDVLTNDMNWELELPEPLKKKISPMKPTQAEHCFLERAGKLGIINKEGK